MSLRSETPSRCRLPWLLCLTPLLVTGCGGGEAAPTPPGPIPALSGEGAGGAEPGSTERPELPGLLREPDVADGVPRIEHFLPSGARIDLVQIAAVPELVPHETGFHLEIGADGQPRLTALQWGGGPPPPSLAESPAAGDEEAMAAWKALQAVPKRAVVALYLDEAVKLGEAESIFELLAQREVATVIWGFSGQDS